MKKILKTKILCIAMSIVLLLQIFSCSTLAAELSEIISTNIDATNAESNTITISCEVVDERTAYSKTFLLSDGSFYKITTSSPIHTILNDEWVDLYDEFENTETIDDVKVAVNEINSNISGVNSTAILSLDDNATSSMSATEVNYLYGSGLCYITDYVSHEIQAGDGAIKIAASSIAPFINKNKAINTVNLVFSRADIDNTSNSIVTIYEGTTNVTSSNIDLLNKIEQITISAIGEYSVDITNLFSKWDLGEVENNGVVLRAQGDDYLTVCNIYIETFFDEVDLNDSDYTYRIFDLGEIGTLYINNYTNTTVLENKLFKLNSKVLPIYVSRINDSTNPVLTCSAGYGFTWNIESTISISGNLGKWKTINLENKYFVPDDSPDIEDGYQVWKEVNPEGDSVGFEDQNSVYFYVSNTDIQNSITDYSNVFIKHGDTKYSFDDEGRLISVQRPGANNENLSVNIIYDESGNLDYITDENNTVYNFDYLYEQALRQEYLWNIWIDGELYLRFGSSVTSGETTVGYPFVYNHIFISPDEEDQNDQNFLQIDRSGNIFRINDLHSCIYDINYVNTGTRDRGLGNRVESIELWNLDDGTDNIYSPSDAIIFESPNNNYRKNIFQDRNTNELISTEIIQFDKEHRIITHKDFEDNFTCVEYNENGIVSSYAFDENETCLIDDGSFENTNTLNTSWNTNNTNVELVASSWGSGEHGNYEIKVSTNNEPLSSISQEVIGNFAADNTYVVGAWIKVNGTLPIEERKIGVQVKTVSNNNVKTEVAFGTIDNGLDGEWQYRLQAFRLASDCSKLEINLTALNQCGEIRFDEITLYEAVDSRVNLPNIDISSSIEYEYDELGLLSEERMTDGVNSIIKSYDYYSNNTISETTDINGLKKYYTYSSDGNSITSVGTIKDVDGNIIDATNFEYNANGLLTQICKTVNGLTESTSTNYTPGTDDLIMKTQIGFGSGIKAVYHNGYTYKIKENNGYYDIYVDENTESANTTINNNEDINLVKYVYDDDLLESVIYANDYTLECFYNNDGEIEFIDYYYPADSYDPLYTYKYEYDSGELSSIAIGEDLGNNNFDPYYQVNYTNTGYSINIYDNELYIKSVNSSGCNVETINQSYFTGSNNTDADTITTSGTVTSAPNSTNGNVTNSSTVIVNKNGSDNKHSQMTYERSSVTDYFNRITRKNTSLIYSTGNGITYNIDVNTNYEYKQLDVGVTSGLISSYSTKISGDNGISGTAMTEYVSYSRNYEYDNKGNIKYVYTTNGLTEIPCEYYEYDDASQLTTYINFSNGKVARYAYNKGGNMVSKSYYDYNDLQFDYENRSVINIGERTYLCDYYYGSKDSLVRIVETDFTNTEPEYQPLVTSITCDELGNPKYYFGVDIDNSTVSGELEWNGYNLSGFENSDIKIEFLYNSNGDRTMKSVYDKSTGNLTYRMTYIWDNGILTNLIYKGGNTEEVNLNIIYDQEGNPAGYITSMGLPYYFLKDINENVIGLVHADGTKICSISYDVFGRPSYTYHGDNLLQKMVAKATAIFNPVTYHGYIYDYETGMYCSKSRCYSPEWGRYINPDVPTTLMNDINDVLDSNLYVFCNNNPVNTVDNCATWSRDYTISDRNRRGFKVDMCDLFASRSFCTIFANQFLEEYGEWSPDTGYTYYDMNSLRIASDLFAHYVGKNAPVAISKVNANWCDDWLLECQQKNEITVNKADSNAWRYEKIWYAAKDIKKYAWSEGIYITL